MYSITLQTSDNVVTSGEKLGQVQFAASSESDGSAAIAIAGSVYSQAEGSFQSASNPASIVFATAAADASAAVDRIKVTDNGHIVPITTNAYDLGDDNLRFRKTNTNQLTINGAYSFPTSDGLTSQVLQTNGLGQLSFATVAGLGTLTTVLNDGTPVGGADIVSLDFSSDFTVTEPLDTQISITLADTYLKNIVEDTSPQLGAYLDAQNHNVSGVGSLEVTKAIFSPIDTVTFASPTTTIDLDEANLFTITLTGTTTLAVSNGATGQRFTLRLVQDGTGNREVNWFGGISWPGGLEPTLSDAAGDIDVFGFIKTGASTYDGFVIGYAL